MDEKELKRREKSALIAIKSGFDAEDDEYGATLFVSHHIEELDPKYWEKHLGNSKPEPNNVLSLLQLRSHWDDDSVFDFTLPDNVTDYVISVRFDEKGAIEEITMES